MAALLDCHRSILDKIVDPENSDLLLIGRGLGLRRLVCTLLKIYDSPERLVLLVNASVEEEQEIGQDLGFLGCRDPGLRIVSYQTTTKERQAMYKKGGLISVTSRILVVDMLQSNVPISLISGIVVLHAEKITPLALEAFIVRLYREKNRDGFLKAFTDQPEHITSGLSPLKNIMKELQLRRVHIYPRFQEDIKKSLERRRADVVELSQNLTESMAEIHHAILQCMNATLSELKRSNTSLELDDFNIENAYFRMFDVIVRRQLDSVWHKVGPKTKQLVNDLGVLRQLLNYLLTYDPLQFYAYCETIIAAQSETKTGGTKQNHSGWIISDAANIIFTMAKRRCYITSQTAKLRGQREQDLDFADDEDAWAALDDEQGRGEASNSRPKWLPEGIQPVCEELPKWNLLSEILLEIEHEIARTASNFPRKIFPGSNVVLIMTSSLRTSSLLSEYLSSIDNDAPSGQKGRRMMLRKLRMYLWWKNKLKERKRDGLDVPSYTMMPPNPNEARDRGLYFEEDDAGSAAMSEALRRKNKVISDRDKNRRRVRGGAPGPTPGPSRAASEVPRPNLSNNDPPDEFSQIWASQTGGSTLLTMDEDGGGEVNVLDSLDLESAAFETEFDSNYGLVPPEETIIVRAYTDDTDEKVLADLQPRFIVMFEPNMDFVRRVEVYRATHPGLGVRVYHMIYGESCEEHKYLASIRKEKESFERLIKEKATMLLPLLEERRDDASEAAIRTISTRYAGGRREINQLPSQIIVDMREFRSTLPSLLHASRILVIPATLTVGDYIITPDMCVERKSLSDLVSSFNSGRLYSQCELMSVHYKHPILLIEFEEDKAFTLDLVTDIKSYAKPVGKYPKKNKDSSNEFTATIQSKLVLLVLHFPRLKIIWSSSPYATAEIFKDLKLNQAEPDPAKAVTIGAEEDPDAGVGVNSAAEELLRSLPGITSKNVKYVMGKVKSVREFCEMSVTEVQAMIGVEPGKLCWEFVHRGDRK